MLLDTQWPSIRLGAFEGKVIIKKWDILSLVVEESLADYKNKVLYCDYPYLLEDMELGDIIKIDSGLLDVVVVKKSNDRLLVKAYSDAKLSARKHVNLPGVKLKLPAISSQDRSDLQFAAKYGFAYVALSFVSNEKDILKVRKILSDVWGQDLQIVSKIENASAIEDLEEIVKYSDIIMVARGDLWVELPLEKIPVYERKIIVMSQQYNKKVIVATEMMESMIEHPLPTRAEVNDVFSAVEQGADYVMLSWETAVGKYPLVCVEMMQKVINEALEYLGK